MKFKTLSRNIFQASCFTLVSASVFADGEIIGNGAGEFLNDSGPKNVQVKLFECKFTINLERNQHIVFNDPDIIIYENDLGANKKAPAHLWQAETTSGYNWQFKLDGAPDTYWFGSMCADISEFPEEFVGKKKEELSPELDLIRESNGAHCPAKYTDGAWRPSFYAANFHNYIFQDMAGENWNGFAVGLKSSDGQKISSLKFCLVHEDKVLIGASESDTPLSLPGDSFQKLVRALSRVKFIN